MAGKKVSKNSRAAKPMTGKFQLSAEVSMIVPLNAGKHAYVTNPANGGSMHMATDSEKFVTAVTEICAQGYAARIDRELEELAARFPEHGWDATRARLAEAGAFSEAVPA